DINLTVVDNDRSPFSQGLVDKILASGYFRLAGQNASFEDAMELIEGGGADLILEIPNGFERGLVREGRQQLFVAVNAINGVKASLGGAYIAQVIRAYNNEIRLDITGREFESPIGIAPVNWFNPHLLYHMFMVPGILAILVTMVGGFLSALNIVKEKEVATIEQINVTPIKKHHFILGKLIPFWVLGN